MSTQGWQGAIDRLRAEVAAVLALDVEHLELAEAAQVRRAVRLASDQLQMVGARLLARVEADGRWTAGGSRTFGEWVARSDLSSVGAALREAELGRALDADLPITARAVAAGEMTLEHAQVLARLGPTSEARRAALAGASGRDGRTADGAPDEASLVAAARTMPVDRFRREVQRWAASVDEQAHEQANERALAAEHLTVARRGDGIGFHGFLTHEHGEVLLTALRAVAGVPAADDVRSREQRQAAALTDLARLVLDRGLAGAGAQVRPHLSVHVSWEALQRLAREHGADERAGGTRDGAGSGAGPAVEPGTFDDGTPVPPSLLARLACDSEISRIVFGPAGQVLDVGRSQRTYTGQLRRAVVARDRTCRYPGCDAPPLLGEVHHVRHWGRGGETSVANGILLCWFHHDVVHRRGLRIAWNPGVGREAIGSGGWTFTRSDGSSLPGSGAAAPPAVPPAEPHQAELLLTG